MCGICGKLLFKESVPDINVLKKMCNTIVHRGPDDEGLYTAPHIGLGQRRLTIIDLSATACAPLSNEDNTIWIVFNGEIYNFPVLRDELIGKGHQFKTNSDTEVIIHLYEEEGISCLKKLNGMFAFALWDEKKKLLFCARDRMGKKPLCFTLTGDGLVFGSEIKAITADPAISIAPDYFAIDQYLTYQFVPSPLTAFKGIKRLGPGEYFTCDCNGSLEVGRYWELEVTEKTTATQTEIEKEIVNRLRKSVSSRLISDVPLGAFLSGGIDSATIVALMAQESSKPVKTFSIGFEDQDFNELPYAKLIAERYKTEHHEFIVKPNALDVLPLLVKHYNEPFADSSAIPTYYVSKMTSKEVTVALSGDGGDESFAGYKNYESILSWGKWDVLPLPMRRAIEGTGKFALDLLPENNTAAKFKRGLAMLGADNVKARRLQFGTILKQEEKRLAYTPFFNELIADSIAKDTLAQYPYTKGMNDLDWLMRHDINFYMPDCLMVKMDIASMANGLEVRSPFLDYEFVEFAASIPSYMKRNGSEGKIILKNAVSHLLPNAIMNKHKTGFGIPIASWLRNEMAPMLKEVLLSEKSKNRGLFDFSFLKKMVDEHIERKKDWSGRLWAFLFLELWFIEFID